MSGGHLKGVGIGGLAVQAEDAINGVAIGGYKVGSWQLEGLIIAAIRTKAKESMAGLAIAGYNNIQGVQRGLTIGLYNRARELHGVQVGLLNYAGNNKGILRWLPIVNMHLN